MFNSQNPAFSVTNRLFERLIKQTSPNARDGDAALAGTLLLMASVIVLIFVPVYHLLDVFVDDTPADLLQTHALWRLPPVLIAIAALVAYRNKVHPSCQKAFLRALTFSVMAMVLGMFSADLVHESGDPSLMARGIIICTFAISLASLSGARELLVIFGLPFLAALAWIAYQSIDLHPLTSQLIDVLMALFIALILSEIFFRIRRHQYELQGDLQQQATTDALTGLANRRVFEDRLGKELARSKRHGDPLSVVLGDLDHFKRINDSFGHEVGDKLLRQISEIIRGALRKEDLAVRWGGEEFLLMLPATDLDSAHEVAERIRSQIAAAPIPCDGQDVPVTISLGVAQLADDETIRELIRRADDAMYRAKSEGRNRVCI